MTPVDVLRREKERFLTETCFPNPSSLLIAKLKEFDSAIALAESEEQ